MIGRGRRRAATPRLALLGAELTPMVAVAANQLHWRVVRVAGPAARALREETGATVVADDELLADPRADLVVVGSDADVRAAHVDQLLAGGANVLVAPGVPWADRPRGWAALGEPITTAPVMQRWFRELTHLPAGGAVRNLSARGGGEPATRWSVATNLLVSARLLGVTPVPRPTWVDATSGPEWELQVATDDVVLLARMRPEPVLERNGAALVGPGAHHPADAFGVTGMLRVAWDDIAHGRRPALDAGLAADVAALSSSA